MYVVHLFGWMGKNPSHDLTCFGSPFFALVHPCQRHTERGENQNVRLPRTTAPKGSSFKYYFSGATSMRPLKLLGVYSQFRKENAQQPLVVSRNIPVPPSTQLYINFCLDFCWCASTHFQVALFQDFVVGCWWNMIAGVRSQSGNRVGDQGWFSHVWTCP